ncbi:MULTISPECIES: FtsW/RodA/SpoVE family cell cycle protein [unclassified Streptomyces]|uniref:FtsW/RodA/SpoVE family cell cycle protein n=1 Tax=unclassified Streptomyces TaxID=2593676 RepID=UPI00382A0BDA
MELAMVSFAVLISVFGHASVGLAMNGSLPSGIWGYGGGLGALALTAHMAVRRFARYADPLILPAAVMLSGLGLVIIDRLDASYKLHYHATASAPGQVMWTAIGVGVLIAIVVAVEHHRLLQRYTYVCMALALLLLMAPAFFPGDTYGAKRWIYLGPVSFQPGEFVKIIIVVFFAGYLTANRDALALVGRKVWGVSLPRGRNAGPVIAVWMLSLLVLVFERDLGTSLIFFGVFVLMLYTATERTSWVIFGVVMAAVGAFIVGSLEPHVHGRVVAWLHPFDIYLPPAQRPAGLISDQAAQALFSFGNGGLTGTGLGQGQPWLIGFAGRSDFILTTIGEELGAVGVMLVLMLYVLLIERGLRTALAATDPFGKLLATGLATTIALQVFVVAGGVTGLIPLTGKALPFLAQGGSSSVANWILVALLIKVSDGAGRAATQPEGNATILTPAVGTAP